MVHPEWTGAIKCFNFVLPINPHHSIQENLAIPKTYICSTQGESSNFTLSAGSR